MTLLRDTITRSEQALSPGDPLTQRAAAGPGRASPAEMTAR